MRHEGHKCHTFGNHVVYTVRRGKNDLIVITQCFSEGGNAATETGVFNDGGVLAQIVLEQREIAKAEPTTEMQDILHPCSNRLVFELLNLVLVVDHIIIVNRCEPPHRNGEVPRQSGEAEGQKAITGWISKGRHQAILSSQGIGDPFAAVTGLVAVTKIGSLNTFSDQEKSLRFCFEGIEQMPHEPTNSDRVFGNSATILLVQFFHIGDQGIVVVGAGPGAVVSIGIRADPELGMCYDHQRTVHFVRSIVGEISGAVHRAKNVCRSNL